MRAAHLLLALLCAFALSEATVVAHWDENHLGVRILPPEAEHLRRTRTTPASFKVTYDANTPSYVQVAVDYVLNLIDSWISLSQVLPIRVSFNWVPLGQNVLGSASPYWTRSGSNRPQALYLTQQGFYDAQGASFDIYAAFSNSANWYTPINGQPLPSQYDFPTVFLHEMMHGLGFSGLYSNASASSPPSGIANNNSPQQYSSVFDSYLFYTTPNPDVALSTQNQRGRLTACTSNAVVFRTPNNGDINLYVPSSYTQGSSIYHLDPNYYTGNSSLMIPYLTNGDAIHYAGLPTLYALQTIGYTLKSAAFGTTPPPPSPSPTPTSSTKPPTSTTPAPTAPTASPAPTSNNTAKPSASPGPSAAPSSAPTAAPTTKPVTTSANPTTGNPDPVPPSQTRSAWEGTYDIDSSACDTGACCCPTGSATVTYDTKSNVVTIETPVTGVCTGSTATLRFGLFSDNDQGGALLWNGATYSVSISGAPALISITSSSCGVSATCASGACLSPVLISASSSVAASLTLALIGAVLLLM